MDKNEFSNHVSNSPLGGRGGYVYSYLKTAESILSQYNGEVPFAIHLKSYFKLNKKFGGRDRKQISHFCYCYFRTGGLFKKESIETKLKKSIFLCTHHSSSILEQIDTAYNEKAGLSVNEKLAYLEVADESLLFPLHKNLGETIDQQHFLHSQLQQPFLYIRIRPKHLANVLLRLKKMDIEYRIIDPYTIQLPNGFKVEEHFEIDKEVVIQDYNSQQVLNPLLELLNAKQHYKVWDCCAASGGKSILLNDLYDGSLNLFVSDIRESILLNLQKRLFTARVMNYKSVVHNLAKQPLQTKESFDIIICDAPCSGSGTWSRTPEQNFYGKLKQIEEYATLQKSIVKNALNNLSENGYFVYITCSVMKKENEEVVDSILKNKQLECLSMQYMKGYEIGADTMFVAVIKNNKVIS